VFSTEEDQRVTVVRARGELDVASSGALRACLMEAIGEGSPTVLDLRDVTFVDAAGIGVLVGARRSAQRSGLSFTLRGPSARVSAVLELTHLSGLVARDEPDAKTS
jgi:anti-sigma B factor antagonist